MANRTDPLISQVSGSDPQNLMEYLTRQRIYDSRYWKETCFGLTVEQVLEESTLSQTKTSGCVAIGHTQFLALTLKLLQLHPDTDLVVEGFVEQAQFKYTRALGALYVRLTAKPADIYTCLETLLLPDARRLRQYNPHASSKEAYSFTTMDAWGHTLLTETHAAGIALPRLAQRAALSEAGYLPDGPRPTALQDKLAEHGGPLQYLKYKALIEGTPEALAVWNDKYKAMDPEREKDSAATTSEGQRKTKKARTHKLFKGDNDQPKPDNARPSTTSKTPPEEGSEEYWNEQRAKLGLAALRN